MREMLEPPRFPEPVRPALPPAPDLIDLPRLTGILRRHSRALALFTLLGLALAIVAALRSEPRYVATATILINPPGASGVEAGIADRGHWQLGEMEMSLANQIQLLQSDTLARKVAGALSPEAISVVAAQAAATVGLTARLRGLLPGNRDIPDPAEAARIARQELVLTLQDRLQVSPAEKASTVSLAYGSPSRQVSVEIVAAYLAALQSDLGDATARQRDDYQDSLASRIAELQDSRKALAEDIQRLIRETPELALEGASSTDDPAAAALQRELGAEIAELARLEAQQQQLRDVPPDQRLNLLLSLSETDPALQALHKDYVQMNALLASGDSGRARTDAKVLEVLRARLEAGTDHQYQRALASTDTAVGLARDRIARLRAVLKSMTQTAMLLEEKRAALTVLQSRLHVIDGAIQDLSARREALLPSPGMVRVISEPQLPLYKVGPGLSTLAVLGLGLGALVGLAYAGWQELRDRTFRSAAQVARVLGVPIMAEFPHVIASKARRGRGAALRDHSKRDYLGAVRRTGTWLIQFARTPSQRSIGIAAAASGGGATTTIRNLAIFLAKEDWDVLLVDCDRYSTHGLTKQMKLTKVPGLTDLIAGTMSMENCIVPGTALGCDVMPLGGARRPDGTSMVSSPERWRKLRSDLARCYDFVLFDLPPLEHRSDIAEIAGEAAAILVVVQWGRTLRSEATEALRAIGGNVAAPTYAVLNGINIERRNLYADVV